MNDIFISYQWDSKPIVHKISDLLKSKDGYNLWLDNLVMNSGDLPQGEMKKGIKNSKLFVAFITKKYCDSQNCQAEILYAFSKKKKCIYVMLDEELGEDEAGIDLLVARSLRLNAYQYTSHNDWPINLYDLLSKDINKHLNKKELPKLVDLESLIVCRVCNKRFNLEESGKEGCRKPMKTNCNLHNVDQNVLCMKCLKERKRTNSLGNETFLCPFDRNDDLLANCTDANRLHNIIRYFEVKDSLNSLKETINSYENANSSATNEIIHQINDNKRRLKEHVQEIINELNNYLEEMVGKLDKNIEKWSAKQDEIRKSLNTDEFIKSTEDSICELENDLQKIEIAVKRNDSSSIDDPEIDETIKKLNDQIEQESAKLKNETILSFKKGIKINDFKEAVGTLEEQILNLSDVKRDSSTIETQITGIHCDVNNNKMENKVKELEKKIDELSNEKKYLNNRLQKFLVDIPEIVKLCDSKNDNYIKIKELIEQKNANVNYKDKDGHTVLIRASKLGHVETIKLLIENGARMNEKDNFGNTALLYASKNDRVEAVKLLISYGANVNEKNNSGNTALFWASREGHLEPVKLLVENGAYVNEKNVPKNTALMWASRSGHLEILKYLIQNGASINERNNAKNTALSWDINYGEVKKLIEEGKARCGFREGKNGNSAIHLASQRGHLNTVQLLIDNGANVNQESNDGNTAIIHAAKEGHLDIVNLLIENGNSSRNNS